MINDYVLNISNNEKYIASYKNNKNSLKKQIKKIIKENKKKDIDK